MRIAVTGASGNVGTAVVEALTSDDRVDSVVGICRRAHEWRPPRTEWVWGDVAELDLQDAFGGADVVIHLSWLFQPMRQPTVTWRSNVIGSKRVLAAVQAAGVPAVVVASSVGAYSPRRSLEPVTEDYPTDGVPQAAYSREKAYVERLLDQHQLSHPERRVVRLRPGFIFQRSAAAEQRRLFLGPFVPHAALRPGRVPLLPIPAHLRLQALHSSDVARAYAAAALTPVSGAFNVAADPILDPDALADLLHSRWVPAPAAALRTVLAAAYRARAVPAAPELFDLLMQVPMMATDRVREELGWEPSYDAGEAVSSFLTWDGDTTPDTPPLARSTSGPLRSHELATGLGARP
jgi:nucleoside-diphosphate-sugar epimerase